jgi:hypothetical protein
MACDDANARLQTLQIWLRVLVGSVEFFVNRL